MLHAGGKFGGAESGYKVSGGLHGVGASVVNALSNKLEASVHRDGKIHAQSFQRGVPDSGVTIQGETNKRGTIIRFWPDDTMFSVLDFDYTTVLSRLRQQAYLTKGITLTLIDERSGGRARFYFE